MSMITSVFLRRMLQHARTRNLVKFSGQWHTRQEFFEDVEHIAGWLLAQGVKPRHLVGVHLEDGLDALKMRLACLAINAIQVPINHHFQTAEVLPLMEDTKPCLVVTQHPEYFPSWVKTTTEIGRSSVPDKLWTARDDEIICIMFTSGTEGRSKGVPQTLGMWHTNVTGLLQGLWKMSGEHCVFLPITLFHYHGLVLGFFGALLLGSSVVIPGKFDPSQPPDPECTHVFSVPRNYKKWLPCMEQFPEAFRHLVMISGSDFLPESTFNRVLELTGVSLINRYGQTESGIIAGESLEMRGRRGGSVGRAVPGTLVRIGDNEEIQVKGHSVFAGYRPKVKHPFTNDGWYRTGDCGFLDKDGFLFFLDRGKEMYNLGGENVSPAQLDALFLKADGVEEAVSYLAPDVEGEKRIVMVIVASTQLAVEVVEQNCRQVAAGLSGLKRPSTYIFAKAGSLPLNHLGKLERKQLLAVFGNPLWSLQVFLSKSFGLTVDPNPYLDEDDRLKREYLAEEGGETFTLVSTSMMSSCELVRAVGAYYEQQGFTTGLDNNTTGIFAVRVYQDSLVRKTVAITNSTRHDQRVTVTVITEERAETMRRIEAAGSPSPFNLVP